MQEHTYRAVAAALLASSLASAGCSGPAPNTKVQGAYIGRDAGAAARPSGIYDLDVWAKGWPPPAENAPECANERAELEKSTGLVEAPSCGEVRARPVPAVGDGDAPIGKPVAPHCYPLGKVILVVEYEEAKTSCSRIVGIGVVPAK